MKRFDAKVGEIIAADYPPRWIVGDIWNGMVTILALERPDETLDDLRAAAVALRRERLTRDRKLAKRAGKG